MTLREHLQHVEDTAMRGDWFNVPNADSSMVKIHLPKPLSVNHLFANVRGKGRVRSQRYNTWRWQAKALIAKQKPITRHNGPVRVFFAIGETGLRKNTDGDNLFKCLLDALVENAVLVDDSRQHVRGVGMEWVEGKEGATAYIAPADGVQDDL